MAIFEVILRREGPRGGVVQALYREPAPHALAALELVDERVADGEPPL